MLIRKAKIRQINISTLNIIFVEYDKICLDNVVLLL